MIAAGDITAGTASGNLVKNREVTGYTYPDSGTAIPAKLTQDWLGLAGVLAVRRHQCVRHECEQGLARC